jgi:hypothetical protein
MATMTDEEIIAAYAEIGIDREGAEAYLAVLCDDRGLIVEPDRRLKRAMALVPRVPVSTGVPTSFPQRPGNDEAGSPDLENPLVGLGTPRRTRTGNPLIKSQLLCQLS